MFPTKETIEVLRTEYPNGTRVRLVKMDDVQAPPIGTEGTVVGVDGIGSLIMHWDNGSSLHVVYGEDEVENIFAQTLTEQGFNACAPYNGEQWAIGAEGAVCLQEGTKVRVGPRTGEGANRAATVFQRLLSARKRLLRVIEHNEGGANKGLAQFAEHITATCDRWDR